VQHRRGLRKGELIMARTTMLRRNLLGAGACALAGAADWLGAASAHASEGRAGGRGPSKPHEDVIQKYYSAWEKKEWGSLDILLADNFTFTSANDDDHISKSAFKARCWESQIDFIERFEVEKVIGEGDEAFVRYLGRTKNGKSFRNVDYFQLNGEKVEAIECYFGGQFGFPSAASTGQK
jgi:ketosteroid isomerase-like protein